MTYTVVVIPSGARTRDSLMNTQDIAKTWRREAWTMFDGFRFSWP
jgi:hypothetical protein